ncbi:NUDIX domain-containing protein [Embleya sp. NPDC020886]|uniref:NUDIX domain-containing protein n=1 Tax=Embleya sp. NPDC020886 TaxID=3363980 RepID=UPI0037BAB7BD
MSVSGVVVDDAGRFLLTKRRDNGQWQAPGGVLELHETIPEGLVREMHEETGLKVEPVALTGIYKNMNLGVVALVFRCRSVGGALRLNDEVSEFRWAVPAELPDLVVEAFAVRVTDALADRSAPEIRAHDGERLI